MSRQTNATQVFIPQPVEQKMCMNGALELISVWACVMEGNFTLILPLCSVCGGKVVKTRHNDSIGRQMCCVLLKMDNIWFSACMTHFGVC